MVGKPPLVGFIHHKSGVLIRRAEGAQCPMLPDRSHGAAAIVHGTGDSVKGQAMEALRTLLDVNSDIDKVRRTSLKGGGRAEWWEWGEGGFAVPWISEAITEFGRRRAFSFVPYV